MNRSELRSRVRTLTNIFSTALLSDAQIDDALGDVYAEVLSTYDWPFLLDSTTVGLTASVATYEVAVGTRAILLISSNTGSPLAARKLIAISALDADSIAQDGSEGWPTHYSVVPAVDALSGPTVTFYPTPAQSETLRVRYVAALPTFASDLDSPPGADEFHPVYAYAAAARLLSERGAPRSKVESMNALAGQYVERMRRFYMTSSDRAPVSAGRRRWRR